MRLVRVSRYAYFTTIFVALVFALVFILSFFEDIPIYSIISIIGFTLLIYDLKTIWRYRLELSNGRLREHYKNVTREIMFKDIDTLDWEIVGIRGFPRYYPKIKLILDDGSSLIFKTSSQAALYDIHEWITKNYPHIKVSETVTSTIRGRFSNCF